MVPLSPELLAPMPDAKLTCQQSRLMQLLQKQLGTSDPHSKPWSLNFFRLPTALTPTPD